MTKLETKSIETIKKFSLRFLFCLDFVKAKNKSSLLKRMCPRSHPKKNANAVLAFLSISFSFLSWIVYKNKQNLTFYGKTLDKACIL